MIYNAVLVSGAWQSESVIHIHISTDFVRFFSCVGHYRVLNRVPCSIDIHTHIYIHIYAYINIYTAGSYLLSILYIVVIYISVPVSNTFIVIDVYAGIAVS